MDVEDSVEILQSLAGGVNPVTGEVFPRGSPYHHPDVIRALFSCIQYLKTHSKKETRSIAAKQAENLNRGLPKNAGMPWTHELKSTLAHDFAAGCPVSDLADKYARSRGSIVSELRKQGLITDEGAGKPNTG